MAERELAERIARELTDGGRVRILVRNVHRVETLLQSLRRVMENTAFLPIRFGAPEPVLEALKTHFMGNSLPDPETAFEAGWRSHLTEMALVSGREGMEAAAGLHSFRESLKDLLLHRLEPQEGTEALFRSVLASFSKTLSTVICLLDYVQTPPFDRITAPFPPVVCLSPGRDGIPSPDSVLDSGCFSREEVEAILMEEGFSLPPDEVIQATGGRAGLVRLYAGIVREYGIRHDNVLAMLDGVFLRDPGLHSFARAAAVLSPGFFVSEAGALSSTPGEKLFLRGKRMHLWRGSLMGEFLSGEVRRSILMGIPDGSISELFERASSTVLDFREGSAATLAFAGSLLARSNPGPRAAGLYIRAAELTGCQHRRADLLRTAALLDPDHREECTFQAALSYYREEMREEALELLEGNDLTGIPGEGALRALCSRSSELPSASWEEGGYPELSSNIPFSGYHHGRGEFSQAEKYLTELALQGGTSMTLALMVYGEQLYDRGLVEASLNVSRAAVSQAAEEGIEWLETRALVLFARACTRRGRFREFTRAADRLLELLLQSTNRRRLTSVYNLLANSMILRLDYGMALRIYESSLRSMGDRGDSLRTVILNNMSVAQRKLMKTTEALGSLMRLVGVTVSRGDLSRACVAYCNMARIFIDLSRFDSAKDCLETVLEFRELAGGMAVDDSISFISAQIAFQNGDVPGAIHLMDASIESARASGDTRRLSLNLLKQGSMLLRCGDHSRAIPVLTEAIEVSSESNSKLNRFVASVKHAAARCMAGKADPWELLAVPVQGNPDLLHRGEQYYYHWRLSGSAQSLVAAGHLLSTGLSAGLHYHSYMHMLQEIKPNIPRRLAEALPLVHNYPSGS